ncbi:GTP-binding protein [Eggerthia catenaformis]|uniref:GTP-binding protein n=1 Tax=Eggerthia catenaformis TaxID=31973 RepID=UPI0028F0830E|nr:GTP-binding protein [Eggerthia catenaformis]
MIKIDLITGFLGSGKTTFIKKYIKYLSGQNQKIAVIENDYGAVNIDRMLLEDELKDICDIEMVIGGDPDCRRRRFKTKLISMHLFGYDRVVVEPSGIYDPDEFFDVLMESPLNQWYEIGNVLAIVDGEIDTLPVQANYILAGEIANAGKIILSKTQFYSKETIYNTVRYLSSVLSLVSCPRDIHNDIIDKNWEQWNDQDYENIMNSGYVVSAYTKYYNEELVKFSSLFFLDVHLNIKLLKERIRRLFLDDKAGFVFRVKGFLFIENKWIQINADRHHLSLSPVSLGQEIIIVIGENLNKELIEKYWQ